MSDKRMYFGNRERMTWVKCPAINVPMGRNRWSASGTFLNGGAYVQSSSAGHRVYQFAWNLSHGRDIHDVLDYAEGIYGDGLIYFLDPFAVTTNVLPQWWAAPRLQAQDAPRLTRDRTISLTATEANPYGYPTQSGTFRLIDGEPRDTLWIPLPKGYAFHIGVHGTRTGDASITVNDIPVPVSSVTTAQLTTHAISGVSGVTISAAGVGTLTLAGMVAQIHPLNGASPTSELYPSEVVGQTGQFVSGRGNSGCRFDPTSVSLNGHSSPEALDLQSATATLIETGAWE